MATKSEIAADNSDCGVCATAEILCSKWTAIIIRDLAESDSRFCELERSLDGISPRTLSLRLRELESNGIVERRTYAEVPPRVEYALTKKGEGLIPIVNAMRSYGEQWLGELCGREGRAAARARTRQSVVA
ncbi:MAG: helix-turn-helix transcriptional regulator [Thermoleophilaceae bacterium]|nr:helix-turn-helix transcriptional regulator [Thermoleophilaceae bacterium]